jgi:hypothetical protein
MGPGSRSLRSLGRDDTEEERAKPTLRRPLSPVVVHILSTSRPREGGDPCAVHHRLSCDYGSRLALAPLAWPGRQRREGAKPTLRRPLTWVGRGVGPSLSLPPKRGGWRAEQALKQTLAQPSPNCARASRRAIAAFRLIGFNGGRTGRRHSTPGGYPSAARGHGLRKPHPRVPHPDPALMTPHESAPRWSETDHP